MVTEVLGIERGVRRSHGLREYGVRIVLDGKRAVTRWVFADDAEHALQLVTGKVWLHA